MPSLPPEDAIKSLTESEATALWLGLRWPGGKPICPRCGGKDHYDVSSDRSRKRWRCKACVKKDKSSKREISLFGGTPFHGTKLSVQTVLLAISIVQHSKGNMVIRQSAEKHDIGYKTFYVLVGKAREFLVNGAEHRSAYVGYMSTKGSRYIRADTPRAKLKEFSSRLTYDSLKARSALRRPEAPIIYREASGLLSQPRYVDGLVLATRSWWTTQDKHDLAVLAAAKVTPEEAGRALGRSGTSVAWRAKDLLPFTIIPPSWRSIFAPPRLTVPAQPRLFAYPYLPTLAKNADASGARLTSDVSALVSRAYPDFMRADVCQIVLLAILEGHTSLNDLRSSPEALRAFVKSYRHNQDAPYTTLSLDAPRWDGSDEDAYGSTLPVGILNRLEW